MKLPSHTILLLILILSIFGFASAATIQIGPDANTPATSYYPVYGNGEYSYTQQLYLQPEINKSGLIQKLRFFYISGNISVSEDWVIYLGQTEQDVFGNTTSWVPFSMLTQVYAGNVSSAFDTPSPWKEVVLDTPFEYNNIYNLVVAVDQNTPGRAAFSQGGYLSGGFRGLCHFDNTVNADPALPPTAKNRGSTIGRIQIVFEDTGPASTPILLSPEDEAELRNGQSLNWALPAGSNDATSYDLYLNDAIINLNQPSYQLSDLANGSYTWKVVANNAFGASEASEIRHFELLDGLVIGEGQGVNVNPFNCMYGYGRSLSLFTSEQIGSLGILTELGYECGTASDTEVSYKIYVASTDLIAQSIRSWESFTSQATMVKQGSHAFDSVGWHILELDSPFSYTQGNLLVGVEVNTGGGGTNSYPYFRFTPSGTGAHQVWQSNNSPPQTNGTLNVNRPNIVLVMEPLPTEPLFILSPSYWDFGEVVINDTATRSFSITNGGLSPLSVNSITPSELSAFSLVNLPDLPLSLNTGESCSFSISFSPTEVEEYEAVFDVDGFSLSVYGSSYDPIIYSYPFFDGFEEGNNNGAPVSAWDQQTESGGSMWVASELNTSNNRSPRTGDFSATLQYDSDAWLMRPFYFEGGQSYDAELFARQDTDNSGYANIGIYYGNSGSISAMTEVIVPQTGLINGDYQQIKGSFTPEQDGVYWLGIHGWASWDIWYITLDDISVMHSPELPVFTYSPTEMDFGIGFANTASSYQNVQVMNNGYGLLELDLEDLSLLGDDAAMFEIDYSNLPFALGAMETGLIPVRYNPSVEGTHAAVLQIRYDGEDYEVDLSGFALSEFALYESFEGVSFPPAGWKVINDGDANTWFRGTGYPHTGSYQAQINASATAHDDWLITPKLAVTAEKHHLSFWCMNQSSGFKDKFSVKLSTTGNEKEDFVHSLALDIQPPNSYTQYSYDLSDFIGSDIYFAIMTNTFALTLHLDDVMGPDIVLEAPQAPILVSPQDMASQISIKPTFSWAPGLGGIPTGYQLYMDTFSPPTTLVAEMSDVSFIPEYFLEPQTTYYWSVKALNPAGVSESSEVFSFQTLPEGMVILGSDSSYGDGYGYPAVYGGYYANSREQYIISADELIASGAQAGYINSLSFDIFSPNDCVNLPSYRIRIAHTDQSQFATSEFITGLTTVFEADYYTPNAGWNLHGFSNPFLWDGVSNLVIQTDFQMLPIWFTHAQPYYSTYTGQNLSLSFYSDSMPWENQLTGQLSSKRPNMMLYVTPEVIGFPAAPIVHYPLDGELGLPIEGFEFSWSPDLINGAEVQYYSVFLASDEESIYDEYYWETTNTHFNPVTDGGISFEYNQRWYWTLQAVNFVGATVLHPPQTFVITAAPAEIEINPGSIYVELEAPESSTQSLTISNVGGLALEYELSFAPEQMRNMVNRSNDAQAASQLIRSTTAHDELSLMRPLTQNQAQRALYDVQFVYPCQIIDGEYGVASDSEHIFVSRWSSVGMAIFHKYTLDGQYLSDVVINGINGCRDLSYDGQYFYGGNDNQEIYKLDLNNGELLDVIPAPNTLRAISYDAENDGFWVSNGWDGPLKLVSRTGTLIRTLDLPLNSISGMAYQRISNDESYMWINTQHPDDIIIHKVEMNYGSIVESISLSDAGLNTLEASAGGLEVISGLIPGKNSLLGMNQNRYMYAIELEDSASWVSMEPKSGTLQAGESAEVNILLDSSLVGPGDYSGTIHLRHNAPSPTVEIPVQMVVSGIWEPIFSISDEAWDFGEVETLNPAAKQFTIRNLGGSTPHPLMLAESAFSITSDPEGNFSIEAQGLPTSLNHDESYRFKVYFTPQSTGFKSAILNITDNITSYSFDLLGVGVDESTFGSIILDGELLNDEYVNLSWIPLMADGILKWDNGDVYSGIGMTDGGTFTAATRFTSGALAAYHGQYLNSIRINVDAADQANFSIKVWQGADNSHIPATLIYSQTVTATNGWNEYILPNIPIPETGSLFMGYEVSHAANAYPAMMDTGPAVAYYGDLISINNNWASIKHEIGMDFNWLIQGMVSSESSGVAKLLNHPVETIKPSQKSQKPTWNLELRDSVSSSPQNQRALQGYRVYRNGTLLNSELINALNYLDATAPAGLNQYHVEAVFYSQNVSSNTWNADVSGANIKQLPFLEDWSGNSFAANAWFSTAQNWSVTSTAGLPAPACKFDWSPLLTDYSETLYSPWLERMDYSELELSFDLALNNFNFSPNYMSVDVFDGNDWVNVHSTLSIVDSFDWTHFSYNITDLVSQDMLKIRFRAHGSNSYDINNWLIDNVMINDPNTDLLAPTIEFAPLVNTPRNDIAYMLQAEIKDDVIYQNDIASAQLIYSTDNRATWNFVDFIHQEAHSYNAEIPAQAWQTQVIYYLKAADLAGNQVQTAEYTFEVDNPVWISYHSGGSNYITAGVTYSPMVEFENPYYGSNKNLHLLASRAATVFEDTAILHLYDDQLNDLITPVPVNFNSMEESVFDLSDLDVQIGPEHDSFLIAFEGISASNYFRFDNNAYQYTPAYVIIGSEVNIVDRAGNWVIDAYASYTTASLEAPELNIFIMNDNVRLEWNAIDGASSYKVYGTTDPYNTDAWTSLGSVSTPSFNLNQSQERMFFKVIAESEAANSISSQNSPSVNRQSKIKTSNHNIIFREYNK